MKIFGFTLLRNGLKYDYPFRECLESLGALTGKVYLALGKSEDGTEEIVIKFPFVQVTETVWDEGLRQGGKILSQQTNVALESLRKDHGSDWGFYLQGDEVIHERDFDRIKRDIETADREGYDAVSFRYLHFWLDYQHVCIGKRWYPQEIRAIKLNTNIESHGDAQTFKNVKKIFLSDAYIFHYGHVREASKYELKKNDFHKLWHDDSEAKKRIEESKTEDRKEETAVFLGTHPKFMLSRIGSLRYPEQAEVSIQGNATDFDSQIVKSIRAKRINWVKEKTDGVYISTKESFLEKILKKGIRMKSPQGRPFDPDMNLIFRLSEKGVGVGPFL